MRMVYGFTDCCDDSVSYLVDEYFTGLPEDLYIGMLPDYVKSRGYSPVIGSRTEAAAQYQDSLFGRV